MTSVIALKQTETFRKWLARLRDERAVAIITARINRLAFGHAGDVRSVGGTIREPRVHTGPGYRVYYQQRGDLIIVLLCGGDKGSQTRDIKTARRLADQWRE